MKSSEVEPVAFAAKQRASSARSLSPHARANAVLLSFVLGMQGLSAVSAQSNDATSASTPASAIDIMQKSPALALNAPVENWEKITDTVFRHLSVQNGLPQFSATALAQDEDGFIWVGTQGGLARWDGYRFRNYLPVPNDPHSLPDNYVMSLHKDSQGRLWVGTNGGGLAMYDHRQDRFVRVPTGENGISHVTVNSITSDQRGGLWLATRDGLNYYRPDTGEVKHYRKSETGLQTNLVRTVTRDNQDTIWVGTSEGVVKIDAKTHEMKRVLLPIPDNKTQRVISICVGTDGKVWIGTFDSGAFYITPDDPEPKRLLVQKPKSKEKEPLNENVFFIQKVADDEIWLGTYGNGILVVNPQTLETRRMIHETNRQSSLADNSVWSIMRDRSGLVWVGSQRGISIHDPSSRAIMSLFGGDARSHGLLGIDFFAAYGAPDGTVWIGSHHAGVSILDPKSSVFRVLKADDTRPHDALPQSAVFTIYPVGEKTVYIGTDKGLYVSDARGTSVKRLSLAPRNPTLRVAAILQVGTSLYIGGPEGLWEVDMRSNEDRAVQPPWAKALGTKFITELKQAPDGAIWMATLQDGLYRYDLNTQTLLNIKPDAKSKASLTHRNVSSMLFDSRGWLWVGMQGGGLDLLRPGAKPNQYEFTHFGKAEKLPNELVNKILEDERGNIWMSTDEGLAMVDPRTMQVTPLGEPDGVSITGYWSTSGAKTRDGNLIFGGVGGLTIVRPNLVQPYRYLPPLVVTNIQIGGKTVAVNHSRFLGTNAETLMVQADANSMVVEFAALDFTAADHNRYAYRLDGYDKDWIETDATRRLAAYTNLPPGDYRLHLRGSNRNGVWSEPDLVLNVKVLPAWYQTWWAYFSYFALFSGLVFVLIRWRLWALREKNRKLENLVLQRTRELEVSRRALEQQSLSDPLTGLRNRRYLHHCINEDLARVQRNYANNKPERGDLIFMMVDIDHFKSVNDQYGHAAGDQVLVQATAILQACVRESDTLIRWGGEEFLIVVRDTNYLEAQDLAERIRAQFEAHVFQLADGETTQRTCSIGFAPYPFFVDKLDFFAWEQVINLADHCLYVAKGGGRNAWVGMQAVASPDHLDPAAGAKPQVTKMLANAQIVMHSSRPDFCALP
ncbi:MAG: GGDEF domain-containing protein [Burkholderiaceae bacterium]|nr:MAG: GGDEF domain-containing protein [Burkholderiaceae bacterium]